MKDSDQKPKPLSEFSPKDRNIIKGALRRAFARSDLHKQVSDLYSVEHTDPLKPRCKHFSWCALCGVVCPTWKCALDHKVPVVPLDRTLEQMTLEELVRRIWCSPDNLWNLCPICHAAKTASERAQRPKPVRKRKC